MNSKYNLSEDELDRLERFTAAYNAVDQYLRSTLTLGDELGFTVVIRNYEEYNPSWADGKALRKFAKLRNVLIHDKNKPYEVLSIPTQSTVDEIEHIRDRLIKTKTAYELFQRDVECVSPKDSLLFILNKIQNKNFSQFPVFDGSDFQGLVTENGITRWLAFRGIREISLVDFEDCTVADVLVNEEKRQNCEIVSRTTSLEQILKRFRQNHLLEAIIVTERGKETEKPLGIVTRWDLMAY